MNYLLKRISPTLLDIVSELEDGEFTILERAIAQLNIYEEFDLSLRICLFNAKELTDLILKINSFQSYNIGAAEKRFMKYKVSQLISNFISSYYNFLAICESNAESWFDKQVKLDIKKIISSFYDNYHLFKFFYKFRNYITHKGLPIHFLFLSNGKFQILLSIKKLIEDYNEWGADLKTEFTQKVENQINVLKIFSDCDSSFSVLAKQLNSYILDKVFESKQVIQALVKDEITQSSEYSIYSSSEPISSFRQMNNGNLTIIPIPLEAFL